MSDHSKDLTPAGTGGSGTVEEPIPNPGLHEHQPRPTDVDERSERRAERQVAALFGLATLCSLLFVVAYFSFEVGEDTDLIGTYGASHLTLGLTLGLALLLIGIGAIQWARKLMSDVEIVEPRHPIPSSQEDRTEWVTSLTQGINDSTIGRRSCASRPASDTSQSPFSALPRQEISADLSPSPRTHRILVFECAAELRSAACRTRRSRRPGRRR